MHVHKAHVYEIYGHEIHADEVHARGVYVHVSDPIGLGLEWCCPGASDADSVPLQGRYI
jgi:hypothetical protein